MDVLMVNEKKDKPRLLVIAPNVLLPLNMASKVRIQNILKAAAKQFVTRDGPLRAPTQECVSEYAL